MLGITLAAAIATSPLPDEPPARRDPPPEFKEMVCQNYPFERNFPLVAQDGFVLLKEEDWLAVMQDYDFTVACLIFEREK